MTELETAIKNIVLQVYEDNPPTIVEDLTGRSCGMDEFRKKYCHNKASEWVRTKIFDRYPEVDFENGGWVINPRRI